MILLQNKDQMEVIFYKNGKKPKQAQHLCRNFEFLNIRKNVFKYSFSNYYHVKYQPSGTGGTHSPPATLHTKMADSVWK